MPPGSRCTSVATIAPTEASVVVRQSTAMVGSCSRSARSSQRAKITSAYAYPTPTCTGRITRGTVSATAMSTATIATPAQIVSVESDHEMSPASSSATCAPTIAGMRTASGAVRTTGMKQQGERR